MRKNIALGLVFVIVVCGVAQATDTRVRTMGTNSVVLVDEANVFIFPSTIVKYPKLVVGEFGDVGGRVADSLIPGSTFRQLGIHWQFGKENPAVLGTYFHNAEVLRPFPFTFFDFNEQMRDLPNQRIDLLYGGYGGAMALGFHLGLVHSSTGEDNYLKDAAAFGVYTFDGGLSFNEGKTDLAGGLQIISFTDRGTRPGGGEYDKTKSEGNIALHGIGRHFIEVNEAYTVVPHAGLMLSKYELSDYELYGGTARKSSTEKLTGFSFDVGSGFQWKPSEDVLSVLDCGLAYVGLTSEDTPVNEQTNEDKLTTLFLPYFRAGFEGRVFKWMDLRCGAVSYWTRFKSKDVTDDEETRYNFPMNATFLGFGFHWNRLRVDTYTDPQLFLDGLHFISGRAGRMNFTLSALYEM